MPPVSMRKETGLPATLRVTLGSTDSRAWGPGHLHTSEASLRRLSRAGSEDSCSGPRGECPDPWRGTWAIDLPMSLYATAGAWTWRGPWL